MHFDAEASYRFKQHRGYRCFVAYRSESRYRPFLLHGDKSRSKSFRNCFVVAGEKRRMIKIVYLFYDLNGGNFESTTLA